MAPASKQRMLRYLAITAAGVILFSAGYGLWRWRESTRGARATCVDLGNFFNATFDANWIRREWVADNLAALPQRQRIFGGVRFRIGDGLIQLSGRDLLRYNRTFPTNVVGIPLQQLCRRLHLLHATMYQTGDSTPVGMLVLHYADGKEETLMFNYGYHVRDWWHHLSGSQYTPPAPLKSATSQMAWTGTNALTRPGEFQRLFRTTFENPRPRVAIASVDYVSAMSSSAPFLLALSVD